MTAATASSGPGGAKTTSGEASLWGWGRPFPQHRLHGADRAWVESNCYVDLWIEILNALGLDPAPALGFTLGIDFEGDQWTFYKFPLGDLQALYGVDVQELNMWRSPAAQLLEQVARGRLVLIEVDSFYLPDTAGVAYQTEHTKTTIGVHAIDLPGRRLGYFHNAGVFALSGADFDGVLRIDDPWSPRSPRLLPYTELVKLDRVSHRTDVDLRARALALGREHWMRRPDENPFRRFQPRMEADLAWLREQPLATFHLWSFGTLRQIGACFEMAGDFADYLGANAGSSPAAAPLVVAGAAFREIATQAKAVQFKCARAVNGKKPLDVGTLLGGLAEQWDRGMDAMGVALERATDATDGAHSGDLGSDA